MSTRGIFGVRIDGQDKISYNHSDSYPSYLCEQIITQILTMNEQGLDKYKELARKLVLVDEQSKPNKAQIKALRKSAVTDIEGVTLGEGKVEDWYCLLRSLQGNLIYTLKSGYMIDGLAFARDSLFCEWGYIVNFDDNLLEVYRGLCKQKHNKGRFGSLPPLEDFVKRAKEAKLIGQKEPIWYPIKLIQTFPLDAIPENWRKQIRGYY